MPRWPLLFLGTSFTGKARQLNGADSVVDKGMVPILEVRLPVLPSAWIAPLLLPTQS